MKTDNLETDFDKNKMQRIMLNLLSNAFKYNVNHGSVNVVLDRIIKDEREYACIQVADTGIGIREETKLKYSTVSIKKNTHPLIISAVA